MNMEEKNKALTYDIFTDSFIEIEDSVREDNMISSTIEPSLLDYMVNDKIKGVIFGQVIGDALGLGTEFLTKEEVTRYYPYGLTDYDQIIQDYHRKRWTKGAWTDDTDMMLCIAHAMIKDKDIKLSTIAKNFKDWFNTTKHSFIKILSL